MPNPEPNTTRPDHLSDEDFAELWELFIAIHNTWGESFVRVEDMASSFGEFVSVKCQAPSSYLADYRSAAATLRQLRDQHGSATHAYVLLDPAVIAAVQNDPQSPVSRLRKLVVEELIRVYVASGGFQSYGGKNYGGFVSGSRYRATAPYRIAEGA